MKKLVSMLLALCMVMTAPMALAAYNDHTDYSQFPLVKEGESVAISVATKRSEKYGNDPDKTWFWIWSEKVTGIDFDVEQILATAMGDASLRATWAEASRAIAPDFSTETRINRFEALYRTLLQRRGLSDA